MISKLIGKDIGVKIGAWSGTMEAAQIVVLTQVTHAWRKTGNRTHGLLKCCLYFLTSALAWFTISGPRTINIIL